jgi:hypothetical protein
LTFLQVLLATNRIETLDPALLRPGRIDRHPSTLNPESLSPKSETRNSMNPALLRPGACIDRNP